jgi:hypothetical protein
MFRLKLLLLAYVSVVSLTTAFTIPAHPTDVDPSIVVPSRTTHVKLHACHHRRDILTIGGFSTLLLLSPLFPPPQMAVASGSTFFYDEKIDQVREPNQMYTGGKIDLNSAFVVCMCFDFIIPCHTESLLKVFILLYFSFFFN